MTPIHVLLITAQQPDSPVRHRGRHDPGVQIDRVDSLAKAETLLSAGGYALVLADAAIDYGRSGEELIEQIRREFDVPLVFVVYDGGTGPTPGIHGLPQLGVVPPGTDDYVISQAIRNAMELYHVFRSNPRDVESGRTWGDRAIAGRRAVGEAVAVVDAAGVVRFWNASASAIFGWSPSEIVGQSISRLAPPDRSAPGLGEARDAVRRGRGWLGEVAARRRDGTRLIIHATETPVHNERGDVVGHVWVARERLPASEDRRVTPARDASQRQAQRLQTVGRLAAGIAHDVNNILTIISVCSATAAASIPSDNPAGADLKQMRSAVSRASGLTRRLLRFVKDEAEDVHEFDLNERLRESISLAGPMLGREIKVVAELDDRPTRISGDPSKIDQLILNLATNARDAMSGGGTLCVGTRVRTATQEFSAGAVELRIADEGRGMSPATLSHIFEPFFTTRSAEGGSGLGLAVVAGIVDEFGGTIGVSSKPGEGTCFTIRIPLARAVSAAVPGAVQEPLSR